MAQKTEQNGEGIDISNMINDVNKVLHQHLTGLLTPMLREKQSIRQVLLNMPMVKQLQEEHLKAQQTIYAIHAEAKALKLFYEGELTAKNAELIKIKQELVDALKKLDDCKNVALEVKEIPQKSNTPHVKIENDTPRKNEKVSDSSIKLATMENISRFSNLGDDDEDEEEEEEEEEDEESEEEDDKDEEEENDEDEEDDDEAEEDEEENDDEENDEEDDDSEADEDEEEDDEEEDDEEEEEDGDFEVEDVNIDGEDYVATNTQNGTIYKLDSEGEILEDANGEFVKAGYYKNGVSFIL